MEFNRFFHLFAFHQSIHYTVLNQPITTTHYLHSHTHTHTHTPAFSPYHLRTTLAINMADYTKLARQLALMTIEERPQMRNNFFTKNKVSKITNFSIFSNIFKYNTVDIK